MIDNVSSSQISNEFCLAQVLQLQGRLDAAMVKYKFVCKSIAQIIRSNPDADVEFRLIPMSIPKIVEVYRAKDDKRKAIAFMKAEKPCHEYLKAIKKSKPTKQIINEILDEMDKAFDVPETPKVDPQEIVKRYMEEKKKMEEEKIKHNLELLAKLPEEREKRIKESKIERAVDWAQQNPISILFIFGLLLFVFIIFLIHLLSSRSKEKTADLRNLKQSLKNKINSPEMQSMKKFIDATSRLRNQNDHHHHHNDNQHEHKHPHNFENFQFPDL